MDAKELNGLIEPTELLRLIAYSKSSPKISGKEIRDYCPIHQGDNQRSLAISQENHSYICHSCGAKGDLIDLYVKSSGIEFRDAIEQLAAQFQLHHLSSNNKTTSISKPAHTPNTEPSSTSVLERWSRCSETGMHPYLSKKKISKPPGVRFGKDDRGNHSLVTPFYDVEGKLQTIQFVNEQHKLFLKGSRCQGSFFLLGDIIENGHVYIAEGVATAMTIWEALEKKVAVASVGSAGNIAAAVAAIRKKYLSIHIKLAIDKSEAAMNAIKQIDPPFSYSIPDFSSANLPEGTKADDFNDLVSICGLSLGDVLSQLYKEIHITPEISKSSPINVGAKSIKEWLAYYKIKNLEDVPEPEHLFEALPQIIENTKIFLGIQGRLMQKGESVIVGGGPKTGKSLFALNTAVSVSTGSALLNVFKPSCEGSVLFLSFEDDISVLLCRLSEFELNIEEQEKLGDNLLVHHGSTPLLVSSRNKDIATTAAGNSIASLCRELRPKLIVVDTLSRAFSYDENCNATANGMLLEANALFGIERGANNNPTLLFIQHLRKSSSQQKEPLSIESIRGAGAFAAGCRTVLGFDKTGNKRTLHMLGANCGEDFKTISINEDIQMQALFADKARNSMKQGLFNDLK